MRNSGTPLHKLSRKIQDQVAAAWYPKPAVTHNPCAPSPSPAYPLTLWLDYRVPSLNRFLGWRWKPVKEKKVAGAALAVAMAIVAVPSPLANRVHLLLTLYRCRLIDADNCFCKPLVDQMRYAGLMRDDDPASMELTVKQVRVATKKEEGTRVVIVPALP